MREAVQHIRGRIRCAHTAAGRIHHQRHREALQLGARLGVGGAIHIVAAVVAGERQVVAAVVALPQVAKQAMQRLHGARARVVEVHVQQSADARSQHGLRSDKTASQQCGMNRKVAN